MRELKRETAERVLMYRLHVEGSHGPDTTFHSRQSAEAEAVRLRRSGHRVVVRPVHTPLPTNPWLHVGA